MLLRMKLMKPKDVVRMVFFLVQDFDSNFYLRYFGFVHFSMQALNLVKVTVKDFIDNGPTDSELEAAKSNLIGGFPLRLESNKKISWLNPQAGLPG